MTTTWPEQSVGSWQIKPLPKIERSNKNSIRYFNIYRNRRSQYLGPLKYIWGKEFKYKQITTAITLTENTLLEKAVNITTFTTPAALTRPQLQNLGYHSTVSWKECKELSMRPGSGAQRVGCCLTKALYSWKWSNPISPALHIITLPLQVTTQCITASTSNTEIVTLLHILKKF